MNLEKKTIVDKDLNKNYSEIIPIKKFILYYIFSMGLYVFYWSYKNWKFVKEELDINVNPILRSIFFVLFSGSLGRNMLELAKSKGYTKTYNPTIIFAFVFIINIISRKTPSPYNWVFIIGFIPLIPIVQAYNFYCEKNDSKLKANEKFSPTSIVLMILGGIILSLSILGDLLPDEKPKPTHLEITDDNGKN